VKRHYNQYICSSSSSSTSARNNCRFRHVAECRVFESCSLTECTCYLLDHPANNSGFRYLPDENIYEVAGCTLACIFSILLPHPNPCFALWSCLDRLLGERSVVPASWGYRPLINPPPSLGK